MASEFAVTSAPAAASFQSHPPVQQTGVHAEAVSPAENSLTSPSPPPVNPGLHVDLALNIVVLQFFNASGQVTQSIPSPKQLQAYQQTETDKTSPVSTLL